MWSCQESSDVSLQNVSFKQMYLNLWSTWNCVCLRVCVCARTPALVHAWGVKTWGDKSAGSLPVPHGYIQLSPNDLMSIDLLHIWAYFGLYILLQDISV